MLFSLAVIFLSSLIIGSLLKRLKIPVILGMLLLGIAVGPHALNILDDSLLSISSELRKIALIIILTRAGLGLNISDLKKVGRPAVMMCFVPASCEIIGMLIFAPLMFGTSIIEAAVLGAVLAAVSPAVVVPKMLSLIENKKGTDKSIPQMILAGASADDVFVIVLFSSFTSLASGNGFSPVSLLRIPTSIISGLAIGAAAGFVLGLFFIKFHARDSIKVITMISFCFLLVCAEEKITGPFGFSGLLAVMALGASFARKNTPAAKRISLKYSKLWIVAEMLLFVLVGAAVDISYAAKFSLKAVSLIFTVLIFRMLGVAICMIKTNLNLKERLFCMIAYIPKATVQAAIGSVPLSMGLQCGELVLTIAVLAILITASLGSFLIDISCEKLLS